MATSATHQAGLTDTLKPERVLDLIFRDPQVRHGLSEFDDLGKKPHEILTIYPKTIESGRAKGEVRYYLKCFKRGEASDLLEHAKRKVEELIRAGNG